jgi:hypothetical protein
MGAIKPWHLFICLIVVVAIVGAAVLAARRK